MGNPKKPTAMKILEGTDRADRQVDNEMAPAKYEGVPGPPEVLESSEGACQLWRDQIAELNSLGMVHSIDFPQLAVYCYKMNRAWELEEDIRVNGETFTTPAGFEQKRPQVNMAKENFELALKIAIQFGFYPAARTKISAPGKSEGNDLEKILGK